MKVLHKIRLQAKACSNYFEMQDESSLKNVDALVLYFVYGSRDEFQVAKEWKQARIRLCWTLAVPDVLSKLFVYVCLCLIFCHSKKSIPRESKYSQSLWRQNQCSASDCVFEVPAQAGE